MDGDKDFGEEHVWGGVVVASKKKDDEYSGPKSMNVSKDSYGSAPRKIPRANNTQGSSSSSAPIDIPDWSKIYGKNNCKSSSKPKGACGIYHDGDDEYDDDDVMVPPHEFIARKLARSQISSFSVCEGMGRTLKGRDLSKVRDVILTKTGFIE